MIYIMLSFSLLSFSRKPCTNREKSSTFSLSLYLFLVPFSVLISCMIIIYMMLSFSFFCLFLESLVLIEKKGYTFFLSFSLYLFLVPFSVLISCMIMIYMMLYAGAVTKHSATFIMLSCSLLSISRKPCTNRNK